MFSRPDIFIQSAAQELQRFVRTTRFFQGVAARSNPSELRQIGAGRIGLLCIALEELPDLLCIEQIGTRIDHMNPVSAGVLDCIASSIGESEQ